MKQSLLAIAIAVFPFALGAAALVPGDALPTLRLQDQHEQAFLIGPDTRHVIFAAEKSASEQVSHLLAAQAPARVDELGIRYLADISAMPTLITRMFALPALRKQPFKVGLIYDAAQGADFPRQSGAITVIGLSGGKITSLVFVRDEAALSKALGLTPP